MANMKQKIRPFLWFDKECEEAIKFYVAIFSKNPAAAGSSKIVSIQRYPEGQQVGPMKGMAWKEFAMAEDPDWFAGNYEYQVPIFVFTDKAPEKHPKETGNLTFTFVTDGIESAVRQAKSSCGPKRYNNNRQRCYCATGFKRRAL